ncbi:hypothetical protein Acr_15g0011780 [Actinidia rufa]|uniref:Uncharacterized protein n=1 Tax=Actinidia rufa TaxID=165716 RepID=A0A7J0FWP4_9ERIC|nr:hypothetical protein Acr_15g0011780 [Actinidia rufa]
MVEDPLEGVEASVALIYSHHRSITLIFFSADCCSATSLSSLVAVLSIPPDLATRQATTNFSTACGL